MILNGNDSYLVFDEEHAILDAYRYGNRDFIGVKTGIFQFSLRDQAGEQYVYSADKLRLLSCAEKDDSLTAAYENNQAKVTLTVSVASGVHWNITVVPKDESAVEWVDFPRIAVNNDLKDSGGNSRILWGYNEGVVVDDLKVKEKDYGFSEPGYPSSAVAALYPAMVQTQFMAYYNDESGMYIGAHDGAGNLKGIDFYPYESGIMLHMRHYCGGNYGESYTMPYDTVTAFFTGEWQSAADIYRSWFEKEGNGDFTPIEENKRLPEWYAQSPVVVLYPVRGTYDTDVMTPNKLYPYINGLQHIERLEKEFNSRILVILMHWEGTAPWAPPYVWPPFGGVEELKKYTDALHERGDLLGLYCSGFGWTQYSKLVDHYSREKDFIDKNLSEVMCLSPKQELLYSIIIQHIRRSYDMCPACDFVVNTMRDEVRSMLTAGVDYIQLLDQQSGGTSYFCYSKSHGHAPVPGKWQVEAMRHMLSEIEKETGKTLIGTEAAAAESYIPYLPFNDNRFEINYSIGRPVPVYAYIFHEYINNYMGNQVWTQGHINFEKSPENVLERLAYSFTAGDMLTVVLNQDGEIDWCWDCDQFVSDLPDQESIKVFIRRLNKWRQGEARKYLHTGKMVHPYHVNCAPHTIHCVVLDHDLVIGEVHTSAWQAKDGSIGQFLVNYLTAPVSCEIDLPAGSYRLTDENGDCCVIEGGRQTVQLKELSAVLLEKTC